MGVPHTSVAEKWAIKEILVGRGWGLTQPEDDESSSNGAEEPLAKVPRCMAKDLVAKKKTTGGASKGRKRFSKGGVPGAKGKKVPPKKVPSRSESGRKYGGKDTQATQWSMGGGFQHGPRYYHADPQGRTYDNYGCWVFRDDEEQTVEESLEEQEQGRDSEEIPLAELQRWEQAEGGDREGGGPESKETEEGNDRETEDSKIEWLAEAHRKVMVEAQAQNFELARKCYEQASKIKASSSRGGAAPMSASSIKASQKLRAQKKAPQKQQGQVGGTKKPHRYRPGTRALMEIRKYQKSVEFLIRKLPFQRVVWEIVQDMNPNLRFTADTIFANQEASEVLLVNLLEDGNLCTIHWGRITVMPRDLNLVMKLRECMGDPVTFAKCGT